MESLIERPDSITVYISDDSVLVIAKRYALDGTVIERTELIQWDADNHRYEDYRGHDYGNHQEGIANQLFGRGTDWLFDEYAEAAEQSQQKWIGVR